MSFSRLNYDTCTYSHNLHQSVGAADYMLQAPRLECQACFPANPSVKLQARGGALCEQPGWIDASSELLGLTRKATNCPSEKYLPSEKAFCKMSVPLDCPQMPQEDTRLSNPPCTLRGTGWNRWEWLCRNPQDKALMTFDTNIQNRLVVKDNHRPCILKPMDPCASLPAANADDAMYADKDGWRSPLQDVQIPSVHWRKCQEYSHYLQQ